MTAERVKHFLIVYNIPLGIADVHPFHTEYAAALAAYAQAEERWRDDDDTEVVLLGSDSLETLKRTHSSYFELSERHADQVVGRELAELGLR